MLNAPETPHHANPSRSLQGQFSNRSFHKLDLPCPDTPQQRSREEGSNTAALHPGISAKYSSSQCLERTSKHPLSPQVDEILSEQSPVVAEPLMGLPANCPFLGTRFFHLQAETRGWGLYFFISKLSSRVICIQRGNKSIVLNSLRGEERDQQAEPGLATILPASLRYSPFLNCTTPHLVQNET